MKFLFITFLIALTGCSSLDQVPVLRKNIMAEDLALFISQKISARDQLIAFDYELDQGEVSRLLEAALRRRGFAIGVIPAPQSPSSDGLSAVILPDPTLLTDVIRCSLIADRSLLVCRVWIGDKFMISRAYALSDGTLAPATPFSCATTSP